MMAVNEIGLPALHPRQGCVLKTDATEILYGGAAGGGAGGPAGLRPPGLPLFPGGFHTGGVCVSQSARAAGCFVNHAAMRGDR